MSEESLWNHTFETCEDEEAPDLFATPSHRDDLAVVSFAISMKAKLARKREEGRVAWEDNERCSNAFLSRRLREHVEKGDPLEVGNLSMMIHQRGERISAAELHLPDYEQGVRDGIDIATETATAQAALMADLTPEGMPENARVREAMEAALNRFSEKLRATLTDLSAPAPAKHLEVTKLLKDAYLEGWHDACGADRHERDREHAEVGWDFSDAKCSRLQRT